MIRLKRRYKTFNNSQRLRIMVGGVQVFTKVSEVCDSAIERALQEIDSINSSNGVPCRGVCGTFFNKAVQVDLIS